MTQPPQRLQYVDVYRGIGILLMVLCHVDTWGWFSKFVHVFHMPMFYVISGFLYQHDAKQDFAVYVSKKTKSLLYPYVVFALLNYLIWQANHEISLSPLIHIFLNNSCGIPYAEGLWFLTFFFITQILVLLIERNLEKKTKVITIMAIASLGCLFGRYIPYWYVPFSFLSGMVGVGLFYWGMIIKKHNGFNDKPYCVLSLILCSVVCAFINGEVNMRKNEYSDILLFWFCACVLSFGVLLLSQFIAKKNLCNVFLSYWGQNAIIVLGMNQIVIYHVNRILPACGCRLSRDWVVYALSLLVLYIIVSVFEKTFLRKLLLR